MFSGKKLTIKKPNGSYFLTLTIVEWVDVFTSEKYCKIITDCLKYSIDKKGLNVYAFVIMKNHINLIVNCEDGSKLNDIIRDFKKFTNRRIIEEIYNGPESRKEWLLERFAKAAAEHSKTKNFKVWQDGNHAIELYNEYFTWIKVNYIHNNPVRAGYVSQPENWKYSSARNYFGLEPTLDEVYCLVSPVMKV